MEEFTQKEYSDYILKGLLKCFPKFNEYIRYETDVLIIEYPSPNQDVIFWISTQDNEITIGLDQNKQCIWHTHMSQFGAYEPESELTEGIKLIKRIFEGKEWIVFDSKEGVYVTDEIGEINNSEYKIWQEL